MALTIQRAGGNHLLKSCNYRDRHTHLDLSIVSTRTFASTRPHLAGRRIPNFALLLLMHGIHGLREGIVWVRSLGFRCKLCRVCVIRGVPFCSSFDLLSCLHNLRQVLDAASHFCSCARVHAAHCHIRFRSLNVISFNICLRRKQAKQSESQSDCHLCVRSHIVDLRVHGSSNFWSLLANHRADQC